MNQAPDVPFIRLSDAAHLLGVKPQTVRQCLNRGLLPTFRFRGVKVTSLKAVHARMSGEKGKSGRPRKKSA